MAKKTIPWILGGVIFLLTLVPYETLIESYHHLHEQMGSPVTRPITESSLQIFSRIVSHLGDFMAPVLSAWGWQWLTWIAALGLWFWLINAPWLKKHGLSIGRLYDRVMAIPPAWWYGLCFGFTLAFTIAICYSTTRFIPDNTDSVAQFFQAKTFKMGRLHAVPPPLPKFFKMPFMFAQDGKWFNIYTPGQAALFCLGLLAGVPWLVGPLSGALAVVLIYQIGQEIYDEKTAKSISFMLMFSPFFLSLSSGFMNNAPSMCLFLAFILCYLRSISGPSATVYSFLGGLALGLMANLRPFTPAAAGAPFALYLLYLAFKHPRQHLGKLAWWIGGMALPVALLLSYNFYTFGHPLSFGQSLISKGVLGFGVTNFGATHTPLRGLVHTLMLLSQLNTQILGWPLPSLMFFFVFLAGCNSKSTWEKLFLWSVFFVVGGHFFFAARRLRYYYEISPLIILLSVRGIQLLPQLFQNAKIAAGQVKHAVRCLWPVFLIYAIFSNPVSWIYNSSGYEDNLVYFMSKEAGLNHAIVFIDGGYGGWGRYLRGFVHNSPTLDDPVIYAVNLRLENVKLMQLYPDRKYFYYSFTPGKPPVLVPISPESPVIR